MSHEQTIEAAEKWLLALSKTEGDAWAMNPERVNDVFQKLIKGYKDLLHYKDTTVGFWCTDIEPDDKKNFCRLK